MNAKILSGLLAVAIALGATAPAALAQTYPGPYGWQQYRDHDDNYNDGDDNGYRNARYNLQGMVTSYGGYNLNVRTGGGDRYVRLHPGTIINPTGITLRYGMRVEIQGHRDGNGMLEADRINVDGGGRYRPY